jgi:hypothetical protein
MGGLDDYHPLRLGRGLVMRAHIGAALIAVGT